jgi:hypothetical protein
LDSFSDPSSPRYLGEQGVFARQHFGQQKTRWTRVRVVTAERTCYCRDLQVIVSAPPLSLRRFCRTSLSNSFIFVVSLALDLSPSLTSPQSTENGRAAHCRRRDSTAEPSRALPDLPRSFSAPPQPPGTLRSPPGVLPKVLDAGTRVAVAMAGPSPSPPFNRPPQPRFSPPPDSTSPTAPP